MPTSSRIGPRCWPNASHASWDSQTSTTRNPLGLSPAAWERMPPDGPVRHRLHLVLARELLDGGAVVLRGDRRTLVDKYYRHYELLVRVGRPYLARGLVASD